MPATFSDSAPETEVRKNAAKRPVKQSVACGARYMVRGAPLAIAHR